MKIIQKRENNSFSFVIDLLYQYGLLIIIIVAQLLEKNKFTNLIKRIDLFKFPNLFSLDYTFSLIYYEFINFYI